MNKLTDLQERDRQVLWHPCSQMKDYETFLPIEVEKALGCYFHLRNGGKILDAISSWWCKSLGHAHPRLKNALLKQMDKFEHVILANTTNETIVELSEKLTKLTKTLLKIFYASDGSSAVEIALKMSLHVRHIRGENQRKQIISLQNSYHGETFFALSVSDLGIYRKAYEDILPKTKFIQDIPYVSSVNTLEWRNCVNNWIKIEKQLFEYKDNSTAIIIEPILQGGGGMLVYSQDFLRRLKKWCEIHNVHLIADEVMTGFGRTGKMFAYQYADIEPDFLCLGKALTSGWLPMSAVLTTDNIYQAFYSDYSLGNSFLHSHTHSGNALAAAVAIETLNIIQEENICEQALELEKHLAVYIHDVCDATKKIMNIRGIGGVVAADLKVKNPEERAGYAVYQKAVEKGVLLRPLGNTLYWYPPINIEIHDLKKLRDVTIKALKAVDF